MIRLIEVNEDNWMAFAALRGREEQKGFLDSARGILARGYAYRASRARVFGIAEGGKAVMPQRMSLSTEPDAYTAARSTATAFLTGSSLCSTASWHTSEHLSDCSGNILKGTAE